MLLFPLLTQTSFNGIIGMQDAKWFMNFSKILCLDCLSFRKARVLAGEIVLRNIHYHHDHHHHHYYIFIVIIIFDFHDVLQS